MATIGGSAPLGSLSKPDPSRTKLVIRRLPPTLPEATFWKTVEPWVTEDTCLWKRYVQGRAGDGLDNHSVFSRAYVLLSTPELVLDFHRGYHGHVFRSKAGAEFQAVVEYAPIQKTPHGIKAKVDARQGTIDSEPDYLSFLETLKMPIEKPTVDVSGPIAQPTTTPLLEHLRKHGKTGKGASRTQKSATSSDVKGRAIASVSAAAAKRAPHADSGPILVAGKGRDVIATIDSAPPAAPAANEEGKKKRTRGKSKGKDPAAGNNAPNATTANGDNAPQGNGSNPPKPPKQSKPKQDRPPKAAHPEGAGPTGQAPRSQTGERGGKTGRGGGGRGRGEGKDRSARGAVTSILSKNAEGEGAGGVGRGGGPGRGRGRGRGGGPGAEGTPRPAPTSLAAASARIDG